MEHQSLHKHKLELQDLKKEPSKVFKKLTCPACEAPIPADNMNINDKIAKCGECDAIFPFHHEIINFNKEVTKNDEVSRPEGIDLIHFQDELDITIDQPFPILASVGIFLFTFLSFIATLIYLKKGISVLIPGGLLMASAFCLYKVLTRRRNKIFINIDQHNMTINWRPKNGVKDRVIDVQEIDQIYIKADNSKTYCSLYLIVNGIDGQKHVPFSQGLNTSLSKARYLKQEIEKQLGITVRKVPESNVDI